MKVSLFITCMCDILSADVGKDTVELLERVGCTVDFPTSQTCCGQPAYNSGHVTESKKAMKQMMKAFKDSEYVVGPSGSCVGMLKQYPAIFADDPMWEKEAQNLAEKSYEISQFLVDVLKVTDVKSTFKGKVTYHTACHMSRILGVKEAPLRLLQNVEDLELIELPLGNDCCGFGGTFAIQNPVISTEMVKEKSKHVASTNADYLVGGDMACLMNIGGRMKREGKQIKIKHIVNILNEQS